MLHSLLPILLALLGANVASAISAPIRLTDNDFDEDDFSEPLGRQVGWEAEGNFYITGGNGVIEFDVGSAGSPNTPHWVGDRIFFREGNIYPEPDRLLLWDHQAGSTVVMAANGKFRSRSHSGKRVAWGFQPCVGAGCEYTDFTRIYLWDGAQTLELSEDPDVGNLDPILSPQGHVMWKSGNTPDPKSLLLWDGVDVSVFRVRSQDVDDFDFDGTRVVWEDRNAATSDYEVHYWDGASEQMISIATGPVSDLALFGPGAAWSQHDRTSQEIYVWDGSQTLQITDNEDPDFFMDAAGDRVVYRLNHDLHVWEGGTTTAVTSDGEVKYQAVLADDLLYWEQELDGDTEVFVAYFTAPPPLTECENGLDDDGDGAIDYPADPGCRNVMAASESPPCDDDLDNDRDGGVDWDGTPADPQCATTFGREGKCGPGPELAIALPPLLAMRRARRRGSASGRGAAGRDRAA